MPTTQNSQNELESGTNPVQGGAILVCDDLEPIRSVIAQILRSQENYEIIDAEDGLEAVEIAHSRQIDVATLDIMMPKMNGLDALVKLKQIDPRIEVIVITGWGSAESRSEAFRRGAFDFLEKPFTPEQLLEAVRSAMLRRRDLGQKPLQAPLAIEEELEGHVLADTTAAFIHKLVSQVSQMTIFAKRMENGLGGIEGEIGTQLREFRNRLQDSLGSTQYLLQRFRNAVGRHPGLMKPISISKVLLDVRDHLSFTFSKPIELTLPDGPCDIPGDYELLWHLFENLIRNGMEALESCKNGRLIVTADLPAQSQEIVITVADNGPGIAPEVLSRIFNPSYSTKPNGLGIGLHLARRAAHIHGGQLVCTSTPSTGTIFTVSLPLGRESKDSLQ